MHLANFMHWHYIDHGSYKFEKSLNFIVGLEKSLNLFFPLKVLGMLGEVLSNSKIVLEISKCHHSDHYFMRFFCLILIFRKKLKTPIIVDYTRQTLCPSCLKVTDESLTRCLTVH